MPRQLIFIMTDTTRFDMLGCYAGRNVHTPCLDQMAAKGVRFEHAYTTQPVCGPARSALFTGMFPHSNGSWANCMPLGADVKTLGQHLSGQGFRCAYIGKWHLDGGDYFGNGQCPPGWDAEYWYDMRNYLEELTEEERYLSRQTSTCLRPEGVEAEKLFGYRVMERALRFIHEHREEDFFLVVSYDEPHGPFLCPKEYAHLFDDFEWERTPAHLETLEGKPAYQKLWARGAENTDRTKADISGTMLYACNAWADSQIGRILDAADQQTPQAYRLYTSDHGDGMQAHCLWAKGPAVYDEIARIPLLIEGPGIKSKVYPHAVSHIDLAPTVFDLLDAKLPKAFQGESLKPQLYDAQETGRPAFIEFNRYEVDHDGFGGFQPMRAAVTDEFKLALHLCDQDELYDLKNDPHCIHNLIEDERYSAERNSLHDRILDWMNETRDPFRGYQWQCRTWRKDKKPSWDVDLMTRQKKTEDGELRQLDYGTGLEITESTRLKG